MTERAYIVCRVRWKSRVAAFHAKVRIAFYTSNGVVIDFPTPAHKLDYLLRLERLGVLHAQTEGTAFKVTRRS